MPKPSQGTRSASRFAAGPARRLIRFRREEEGGILFFSFFMLIGMLAMAGVAIDFMRFEVFRTKMQATLDRAVLAAAGLGNDLDAKDVVMDYFEKAGLEDYISPSDITVVENKASGTVTYRRVSATAGGNMGTYLLKLVNIDTLSVGAAGTAEEGVTDLEISLVVDVSGSMGNSSWSGYSKIYEMREAAKDFVYYMQCNPVAERSSGAACTVDHGKVSISVVPYAEQVNVGSTLLGEFKVSDEHESSHCVNFDAADFQSVGISTTTELERTGHFDPWSNGSTGNYASANSWTCKREGWREIKPFMDSHTDAFSAISSLGDGGNTSIDLGVKWGAALLDPSVRSVVTNLTTKSRPGETEKVIDSVFQGRPYDYGRDYNMKVIVLMTDGQNTSQHYLQDQYREGPSEIWHYRMPDGNGGMTQGGDIYSVYHASNGKYLYVDSDREQISGKTGWHDSPYAGEAVQSCTTVQERVCLWWAPSWCWYRDKTECTSTNPGVAYQMTYPEVWAKFPTDWYDDFDGFPDPVSSYGNSTKNTRAEAICQAAKDAGILIYSIGFEVPSNSDAEQLMKACASNINNYFAANGTNLDEVFASIATSINKLRLTQ